MIRQYERPEMHYTQLFLGYAVLEAVSMDVPTPPAAGLKFDSISEDTTDGDWI